MDWYHTIELAPGVETAGWFDLRKVAARLPWPDLSGRRCLDVGTFDGFWAFEMERRGAAEVVAIDLLEPESWDWPAGSTEAVAEALNRRKHGGSGFETARKALGSSVARHELSVYDLDPERLGRFDFIYLGSLLLHLRDPVGALEHVRAACSGELMLLDAFDPWLTVVSRAPAAALDGLGRPWWWRPSLRTLGRFVESAGFELLSGPRPLLMPRGRGQPRPAPRPRLLSTHAGRTALVSSWIGDPHAFLLARPDISAN